MNIHCLYDKLVPISKLVTHPKNRNKHPDDQITRLAQILDFQGWRYPVKVSKQSGFVTSGHGRIEAAKKNGWNKVPVNYQDYESEAQEYADVQADNAIASWAELDLAGINTDLGDLGPNFDIDLLGIKDFAIDVSERGDGDADAVPEPPKVARSKRGELYILGEHRLLCGDATSKEDVERLMGREESHLCFTSPPYGDMREYEGGKDLDVERLAQFLKVGAKHCRLFAVNLGIARRDHEILQYWDGYIRAAKDVGLKFLSWNVWDKGECGSVGNQTAMFGIRHEWILVFGDFRKLNRTVPNANAGALADHTWNRGRDGKITKGWSGSVGQFRQMDTVINQPPLKARNLEFDHPAMFPTALPTAYIRACTPESGIVYEPFGGSGTTMVSCEETGRRARVMELEPIYADVILNRWSTFAGRDPVREDGTPWSKIKAGD